MAQGFRHAFQAVQDAGSTQNVSRVGALAPSGFEETAVLCQSEHGLQEAACGVVVQQTGAKLAEDRVIKAGINEFETEQVLPINSCAHGVRGLAVSKALQELEDGSEGQTNRSRGGLALVGEEVGEIGIIKDDAEFIVHVHDGTGLREDSPRDPSGFLGNNIDGLGL